MMIRLHRALSKVDQAHDHPPSNQVPLLRHTQEGNFLFHHAIMPWA